MGSCLSTDSDSDSGPGAPVSNGTPAKASPVPSSPVTNPPTPGPPATQPTLVSSPSPTPPAAPTTEDEKKKAALINAENVLRSKTAELDVVKAEVEEAKKVKVLKLAEAEKKKQEAEKKAEDARLLEEAYKAKKEMEDTANAVKEASMKESTLKEVAERAKVAAEAAIGSPDEDAAAAAAADAEAEAHRASLTTAEAIEASISTTSMKDEASQLIKKQLKTIEKSEWTVDRIFALFDVDGDGNLDREEIKVAITAIAEQVPSEEQLAQAFAKYDTNGDGQFQRDELESMLGDSLLKRKRKGSVFGRKNVEVNIEEQNTIQVIKEDLASKELVLMINKGKAEAEALASDASKTLSDHEEHLEKVASKEKAVLEVISRQEKVVESIKEGEWSDERVFAAFDADKNGNLDASELKLALTSILEKEVSNSDAAKLIKKYDIDGDGFLSFDEFQACVKTAHESLNNFFNNMFTSPTAHEDATEKARQAIVVKECTTLSIYSPPQ